MVGSAHTHAMAEALLAGLITGYGLAVPVGAVAVLMVNMTAHTSFRMGAAAAVGAVTADGLYAVAAVVGGTALASVIRPIAAPLTWVAALVLLAMAVRIARGAVSAPAAPSRPLTPDTARRSYLTFLGLTALNPWPAVYFVTVIVGRHGQVGMTDAEATVYVGAILAASASWQLLLAAGGAVLGRTIASPRSQRLTALVSAALIGGLAVSMPIHG